MGLQDKHEKMVTRQNYSNVWHTDIMDTMGADLPYFLFAACCPHCASYSLQKRALYNDMSRYECCGGYMPCSGKCGESHCPKFCLCTEVFCCFNNSVASTHFLLQDEFNIQTMKCDSCIIGFMFCLGQIACIFRLIACITNIGEIEDAAEILTCLSDSVYCTVCACMQAQHKIEMDKRDGKFGPLSVMMAPPIQQMSQIDLPMSPPIVGSLPPPLPQPQQYPPPYPYPYPPPPTLGYPATPPPHPLPPPGYPAAVSPQPGPPGYYYLATGYPTHPLPPPTDAYDKK